ncbi:MAG: WD40 repeat domain-containing protein [Gemmatimonas sp.]
MLVTAGDNQVTPGQVKPPIDSSFEWLRVWDTVSGQKVKALRGVGFSVTDVGISNDCGLLASVGRDSTLRIWDFDTGALVFTRNFRGAFTHAVAFSPHHQQLALAADNTIYVASYTYQ